MLVHCFTTSEGHCAALSKNDPASLPAEFDPWQKLGELEISSSDPDRIGMPTAETLDGLETHGCYFFYL